MVFIENQRILSISRGGGKIARGGKIAPVYGILFRSKAITQLRQPLSSHLTTTLRVQN